MENILNTLSSLLWDQLAYVLVGIGIFFTLSMGFVQFRHFRHMFSVLKHSKKSDEAGISSFQALCTGLAARVGTGNLAGVAVAICLGGPGAVFWMWLIAMIGMASAFVESTLAQLYKIKDPQGNYRGGPAYYMEKGLGKRWMGVLFSVCLILSFGLIFNAVQSNSICEAMRGAFNIPNWITGVVLLVLSGTIIFGGLRGVARISELVVPFMAMAYLGITLFVVITHLSELPNVIVTIVKSAFGFHQAGAGAFGYTVAQAMINGIKRGLFSNEAGMGSAPNTAATASPYPPHPASQGYMQMLGVFIDTMLICTSTAALILLSDQYVPGSQVNGIQLTQAAMTEHIGSFGSPFIALAIFFFAFTSIFANYAYAENNVIFLGHTSKLRLFVFRMCVLAMVVFGALASVPMVWTMADISMAFMIIINLVSILLMSKTAFKLARDYNAQRKAGKLPTFDASQYPELKGKLEPGIWD